MEKSRFEARDTTPNFAAQANQEKYLGTDARRYAHRVFGERRGEVRFDLNGGRRQNPGGRRSDDVSVNFF